MCYNGKNRREDAKNTAVFETSHQLTEISMCKLNPVAEEGFLDTVRKNSDGS